MPIWNERGWSFCTWVYLKLIAEFSWAVRVSFERCEQPIDVKPGLKIRANSSVWLDFRGEKSPQKPPLTLARTCSGHYWSSLSGRCCCELISLKKSLQHWTYAYACCSQCAGAIFNLNQKFQSRNYLFWLLWCKKVCFRQKIYLLTRFPPK